MQKKNNKTASGQEYWEEVFRLLRDKLSKEDIQRWFSNVSFFSFKGDTITISVPSAFIQDQIQRKFGKIVRAFLFQVSERKLALQVTVQESSKVFKTPHAPPLEGGAVHNKKASSIARKHAHLQPRYTFDNFIIGENSAFAANASIAISRSPGTAYNPFLLYGGVGLGKTHLIQSIGNWICTKNESFKVLYITTENFINEFIQSIREKKTTKFKNRYRNTDILLLDDIQFLRNKTETQEELFHTFNALYDSNKQMVFTCDRHVEEIRDITDRLKSRFKRGLNIDLRPPPYETRVAILRKKIEEMGATDIFSDTDVIYLIAEQITTNVRDLESALTKLVAYAQLVGKSITPDVVKNQLISAPLNKNVRVGVHDILKIISEYFNVSTTDIKGVSRKKSVIFPRHVAMYIVREVTELSTTEIGLEFAGKDHTTIMSACQKIKSMILADSTLESTINALIKKVNEL